MMVQKLFFGFFWKYLVFTKYMSVYLHAELDSIELMCQLSRNVDARERIQKINPFFEKIPPKLQVKFFLKKTTLTILIAFG